MFMIEIVEGLININEGETLKFMIDELKKRHFMIDYKLLYSIIFSRSTKKKTFDYCWN